MDIIDISITMKLLPVSSRIVSNLPTLCSSSMAMHNHNHHLQSIIVILGSTGTGKTKLSIDIATQFRSEIINSDKIQVYTGLDITTNKVPVSYRRDIPHHLLGTVDPTAGEFTAAEFRPLAASAIDSIASRGKVPVITGGSNSFVHALVSDQFDPRPVPFDERVSGSGSRHRQRLRYRSCFLWVDVEREALREYLDRRVDEMVGSGMVEELKGYFCNNNNNVGWQKNVGLNKAIGVPEFWGHFGKGLTWQEAVRVIKENTWLLAEQQRRKIRRLQEIGWDLHRVDATDVVRARLDGTHFNFEDVEELRWKRDVVGPAFGAVEKVLGNEVRRLIIQIPPTTTTAASCSCY